MSAKSSRPRMLVVGCGWPPETFLQRLFRGLIASGIEVWLAQSRPLDGVDDTVPGLRRLALPGGGFGGSGISGRVASLVGSVRALGANPKAAATVLARAPRSALRHLPLLRQRFDLLYFPWNSAAVGHLPLLDAGIATLVSCRGSQIMVAPYDPQRRPLVDGLAESFARASAVHCVTAAIRDRAAELGLDPAKATVIHPGVDVVRFSPADRARSSDGPFRLVQTGSLRWVKGWEYALRAVRLLVDQGRQVELHALGDGPERQRLLFSIDDLDLGSHVHWHGAASSEEVRDQLRRAHAFLLPSLAEGMSNAALEAMACALPVVSSRCGGMPEAIEDGRDGLLVPLRDPAALAAAVGRLMDDPVLARRLGAAARQRVEREFGLDLHVEKFRRLCLDAMRNPNVQSREPSAPTGRLGGTAP